MKKTLLATAILSGLVSASAQAATVYDKDGTTMQIGGRAEVRGEFIGNEGTMTDKSRARIHFKGKTEISEGFTGFAKMEYELKPDSSLSTRYLYAGLGTSFGDFSYGRQDTANVQISDMTDIASVNSGIQQYIGPASDKENNTFLYSNTFAEALSVQVNYIAEEDKDADSFGVSALWSSDFGLDLGASYTAADEENQATVGAAFTAGDLYVAATYAVGEVLVEDEADDTITNLTDFSSLEAAVQYKLTKEFRLIGTMGLADNDGADTYDFYSIEAQYRFNKLIRTFVTYALNNVDGEDDSLIAGLRYNF